MENPTATIDILKLMSLADDLNLVLKNSKDADLLIQTCMVTKSLHRTSEEEFHDLQGSLLEYEKRVDVCKQSIVQVEGETISDAVLEDMQKQLEDEDQRERLLRRELRRIKDEMVALDQQRVSLEERRAAMKRKDKDLSKSRHVLSMCASMTSILPDLGDESKVSGYIVDKDKNHYETFEFESTSSPWQVCNTLWEKVEQ